MIAITVFQSKEGVYQGFCCKGHAGFAQAGSDIVCAAVSMLVINTINAIEQFGKQEFTCKQEESEGSIELMLTERPTEQTTLLLDTMLLGLKEVEAQYHKRYVRLKVKEV